MARGGVRGRLGQHVPGGGRVVGELPLGEVSRTRGRCSEPTPFAETRVLRREASSRVVKSERSVCGGWGGWIVFVKCFVHVYTVVAAHHLGQCRNTINNLPPRYCAAVESYFIVPVSPASLSISLEKYFGRFSLFLPFLCLFQGQMSHFRSVTSKRPTNGIAVSCSFWDNF